MPVQMRPGVEIDYLVSLYGLPIPWTALIDVWESGVRFVDRQTVGPYSWWRHDRRFEPASGGTLVIDHVEYVPRGRWFSREFVRGHSCLKVLKSHRDERRRRPSVTGVVTSSECTHRPRECAWTPVLVWRS